MLHWSPRPSPYDLIHLAWYTDDIGVEKSTQRRFERRYVPHSLKQAILKPLRKKASLDHEIFSNFRPTSNLKFVAKLTGKVVANRLVSCLEQNHLDECLQSAYKKFHSCETALVHVHNDMLQFMCHCQMLLCSALTLGLECCI